MSRGAQRDVMQDRLVGTVAEGDGAEFDLAFHAIERVPGIEVFLGFALQDGKDALGGGKAVEQGLIHPVQPRDGLIQEADEEQKFHQLTGSHAALHAPPGARHEQQNQAGISQQRHRRSIKGPRRHEARLPVFEAMAGGEELPLPHLFHGEALDLPDASDGIVQRGIERAGGLTRCRGPWRNPARIDPATGRYERRGCQDDERELGIRGQHDDGGDDDLQCGGEPLLDAFQDHSLGRGHVIRQFGEDVPSALMVKPAQRQQLHLPVQLAAQIGDHALLKGAVHPRAEIEEALAQREGQQRQTARAPDEVAALVRDDFIHEPAHDARKHKDERGTRHGQSELPHGDAPVTACENKQAAQRGAVSHRLEGVVHGCELDERARREIQTECGMAAYDRGWVWRQPARPSACCKPRAGADVLAVGRFGGEVCV